MGNRNFGFSHIMWSGGVKATLLDAGLAWLSYIKKTPHINILSDTPAEPYVHSPKPLIILKPRGQKTNKVWEHVTCTLRTSRNPKDEYW